MTKFKKLDHPVNEEEFYEYSKAYFSYLSAALDARDRGENVDDIILEIKDTWRMAGILDENYNVVPEYAKAIESVRQYHG